MVPTSLNQWWIYREGAIVGPVTADLVVRGLMAGKIPHDARVRADELSAWVPILSIDAFADATQSTTVIVRPESLPKIEVAPAQQPMAEGRFWFAPEWMLLEGEAMSGPFSLDEIQKKRPPATAQVCRLHTFDWVKVDEAFASGRKDEGAPSEPMYFVQHAAGEQGPTSIDQLARAHAAGRLNDEQLVTRAGTTDRLELGQLLREHGLQRPRPMDRTVVVARKLGSEPPQREPRSALFLAILGVVVVLLVGVALALR